MEKDKNENAVKEIMQKYSVDNRRNAITYLIQKQMEDIISNLTISQKELAEIIGVTPTAISEYKKGKKIPSAQNYLMILSFAENKDYLQALFNIAMNDNYS